MGPSSFFVNAVWRETRACPLEELKSCPRSVWAFCWDWVRFSGGVLIHIWNVQSYNKAKGSDNVPATRERIVELRPPSQIGKSTSRVCGRSKMCFCLWPQPFITTAEKIHSLWKQLQWSLWYLHSEWEHLFGLSGDVLYTSHVSLSCFPLEHSRPAA